MKSVKKNYLMTPGPAPVPIDILLAGAADTIHHRTPQYLAIQEKALNGLKDLFQTKNDIYILSASGTGAMEAAVANLVSPGTKAIAIDAGKFGERWMDLCKVFGADLIHEKLDWGTAITPERVKELLAQNPDTKVIFATLSETSTGAVHPIKEIAAITKDTDVVLVVDAISGLLAQELKMDEWGVDVVVTGVQKGFMMPPGIALITLSEKAWKLAETTKSAKYYFNLKKYRKGYPDSPYTPPINLVYQLEKSVQMLNDEGIENIWARHQLLADATRAGVKAMGLDLFAGENAGNVLTSVNVPGDLNGEKIINFLRDEWGVAFAGGQDHVKGKIIRIAHLGFMTQFDVIVGLSALEMGLNKFGYKVEPGIGVKAAEEVFMKAGL